MQLFELLDELSEKLGIALLRLDNEETLTLAFDDVTVSLEARNDSLLLISKLAALPQEFQESPEFQGKESSIYEFLLSMSVLGKLDVYVGLQEQNNMLTCVSRLDDYALTCDVLEQRLERHIQVVEVLREAITELMQSNIEAAIHAEHHAIRI